jgi:hypothetical protein
MAYNVNQGVGPHEVEVQSINVVDKDGDGANIVLSVVVKFRDGELGQKDLYPCKGEKALGMARKSLKAMNFDIDKRSLDDLCENPATCAGVKIQVTVEENEYNGAVTNRIAWINAIPKTPPKKQVSSLTDALRLAKKANAEEAL